LNFLSGDLQKKIDAAIFGLDYVFVLLNVYFEVQFDSFQVF
jgi:hypothetical protein